MSEGLPVVPLRADIGERKRRSPEHLADDELRESPNDCAGDDPAEFPRGSEDQRDEDEWCVDASIYLRRIVPTAGLVVVPRTGHTVTSEEPGKFNAALEELFADAERGRWLSHKPASA